MKKMFMIMLLSMILILPVYAKENKLYFTNSGDRLFYRTDLYDEDVFMKHLDMLPGSAYTDELTIENATNYDYKLYLKVKKREQNELADELLKNIKMDIYLDGVLLYSGFADGLDYSFSGINLQEAIYVGEYKSNTEGELVVHTMLAPEYSNTENHELSYIDWEFVAEYDELVIPINPDTGENTREYVRIAVISLSIMLFLLLIFIFVIEKRRIVIKKL